MYEYITGSLVELNPAYAVIESKGIGYYINISVYTYSQITGMNECKLLVHQVVREDAQLLFGFFTKIERDLFRMLISVSGVGANTARMVLSNLSPEETKQAILTGNAVTLQSIKGIGLKSAQRIIIDLKDKVGKAEEGIQIFSDQSNTLREEALSALVTLGFPKKPAEKIIDKLLSENKDLSIEDIVKLALKSL